MAVISVRVPDELKEKMKKYNINWSEEIRRFIATRINEEEKKRTLEIMHELLAGGTPAKAGTAKRYVREDRDSN
ncbi:type II toxin-antitoxin system VapB family antitoxin [Thermococcus prieurii]